MTFVEIEYVETQHRRSCRDQHKSRPPVPFAEEKQSESESTGGKPQHARVQVVCHVDEVSSERLYQLAGCAKGFAGCIRLRRAYAVSKHERIIEVEHVEQHPKHRSKDRAAHKENGRFDSSLGRDD